MKLPVALAAIVIAIFLLVAYLAFFQKKAVAPTDFTVPVNSPQVNVPKPEDEALKNALNLYITKKQEGVDFTNGPCLGKIADDWVLDIAHNPRQEVDNQPANQCSAYREGKARNFIELDEAGNVIRIYSPYLKEE